VPAEDFMAMTQTSAPQQATHVANVIDGRAVNVSQYAIACLCACVMFLDGFNTQTISYMIPLIAKEWQLSHNLIGPILASALAGLLVGYLFLSPLSDRVGHRRIVLIATVTVGVFTFGTLLATNAAELIVLRFITGIGLGAAIPSAVALTSEYTPKRLRATFVLAIYCGLSFGFAAAGGAAAWLIPHYGWRALLWAGAVSPLALAPFIYLYLPESLDFLIRSRAEPRQIQAVLARIGPAAMDIGAMRFESETDERSNAVASLFQSGRTLGTLLLWVVFVLNLAEFYALQSWLPPILTRLNYSIDTVALVTSLTTIGGIVAAFIVGPAMDRLSAYGSVAILYLAGVVFVALTEWALSRSAWMLMTAAFFAGFCVSGGQKSVIALTAMFYPAPIRSTGIGWALGVGRIGSIAGPLVIGALLGWQMQPDKVFYVTSLPMLIAALIIVLLGAKYGGSRPQS
jgi:MFS transporter, AAHS family, 4-hydroxybenzoate transporter